jgi:hypothetical protein
VALKMTPPKAPAVKAPKAPKAPQAGKAPKAPSGMPGLKLGGGGGGPAQRIVKWTAAVLALAVAVFLVTVWISWKHAVVTGDHATIHDAIWLAPTWTQGYHDPSSDVANLVTELDTYQFSHVFVTVGTLTAAGTLPPNGNPYVTNLLGDLRALAPTLQVDAAILGRPKEGGVGGPVNLANPTVRANIVSTASQLLKLGFTGIHLDLAPVSTGDSSFVKLVSALHPMTTAHHAQLSVEGGQAEPFGGAARVGRLLSIRKLSLRPWTFGYYHEVASQSDQVVVRGFGSGLPTPWTYGSYVGWETHELLKAIGPRTTLIMDLAPRGKGTPTHEPWAENLGAGVRGVRHGLDQIDKADRGRVGISIRGQATATPADFAGLGRNWVCTAFDAPSCVQGTPPTVEPVVAGIPSP